MDFARLLPDEPRLAPYDGLAKPDRAVNWAVDDPDVFWDSDCGGRERRTLSAFLTGNPLLDRLVSYRASKSTGRNRVVPP